MVARLLLLCVAAGLSVGAFLAGMDDVRIERSLARWGIACDMSGYAGVVPPVRMAETTHPVRAR